MTSYYIFILNFFIYFLAQLISTPPVYNQTSGPLTVSNQAGGSPTVSNQASGTPTVSNQTTGLRTIKTSGTKMNQSLLGTSSNSYIQFFLLSTN